ncbi:helix-turn-helix transcriptional regulator [Salmonella bongori]|uniref:Helix-turn-helix transcriptional regulator n=3 Tax=Salmonella TaxID=590 RepID=A0A750KKN8_SALER|nr:helix-turn-helix transcriptional regulator [Salmonella bongori]EGE4654014.1 helix-turn-helix transcriptional regulator [Salmonella bongori serovar 40:z35:- str. 95-0123]EGS1129607.1 helix-turn-helix transcriptional regulator [Salmonella bongori CFSAN000509]HAC6695162.1 helix-turn-helix transcriptional regulator [Salmonella bongori serovar 44:r:-]AID25809.1 RmbA [Salmonella bongori serovar 48:z41:-- str. RKS3044]ECC8924098.1 helix-turn-helix transcriptional regulator [Salmonella bongori]
MIRQSPQILRCISCELSCQLFPDSAVRVQYCNNAAFAIWPDGNVFLKKGIIEKLLLDNQNYLSRGFVFVDFSFPNLRRFADLQWIDRLSNSGMHIVLISDRSLTPLANYWLLKSNKIQGIIYSDDDDTVQQQKIHRLFTGRLANSKRGRSLNYTEFILLKYFMAGISIQQIIRIDNIDIKKIYVHKLRLENKLGHSIHKIISNIL